MYMVNNTKIATEQNRFVIVGRCMAKYISYYGKKYDLRMTILRVDTRKWVTKHI